MYINSKSKIKGYVNVSFNLSYVIIAIEYYNA